MFLPHTSTKCCSLIYIAVCRVWGTVSAAFVIVKIILEWKKLVLLLKSCHCHCKQTVRHCAWAHALKNLLHKLYQFSLNCTVARVSSNSKVFCDHFMYLIVSNLKFFYCIIAVVLLLVIVVLLINCIIN